MDVEISMTGLCASRYSAVSLRDVTGHLHPNQTKVDQVSIRFYHTKHGLEALCVRTISGVSPIEARI